MPLLSTALNAVKCKISFLLCMVGKQRVSVKNETMLGPGKVFIRETKTKFTVLI